jgi:hypothetical protein
MTTSRWKALRRTYLRMHGKPQSGGDHATPTGPDGKPKYITRDEAMRMAQAFGNKIRV